MKHKMLILLSLLLTVCMLPLNAMAGLRWGQIVRITSKSAVNVRTEADAKSKMVGEAMSGNTYTWLKTEGDWYYIQFTSEDRGYVPAKYSALEEGLVWNDLLPGEVEAVVRNTHTNPLNVRTEPSKNSSVIGEIDPDSTWPYCGTENGWHRILYEDEYAFVAANRTTIEVVDTIAGATTASGLPSFASPSGTSGSSISFCRECTSGQCSVCDGDGQIYSRKAGGMITCPACEGALTCWACGGDKLR